MKEGENGWYTAKAPMWVNSVIVNANEGSVQTEDITIDPAEVWITIAGDGTFDFSYTDPDKAAIPDITVRVMAPKDWENPCLWAWSAPDGTNVYTTWPGEALEADENGWIKKEIPGWVNSIIINGNEGGIQTTDISIDTEKDVWVVVSGPEAFEVSYEEPEISAPAEAVSVKDTEAESAEAAAPAETKNNNMIPIAVIIIIAAAVIVIAVVAVKKKSAKK